MGLPKRLEAYYAERCLEHADRPSEAVLRAVLGYYYGPAWAAESSAVLAVLMNRLTGFVARPDGSYAAEGEIDSLQFFFDLAGAYQRRFGFSRSSDSDHADFCVETLRRLVTDGIFGTRTILTPLVATYSLAGAPVRLGCFTAYDDSSDAFTFLRFDPAGGEAETIESSSLRRAESLEFVAFDLPVKGIDRDRMLRWAMLSSRERLRRAQDAAVAANSDPREAYAAARDRLEGASLDGAMSSRLVSALVEYRRIVRGDGESRGGDPLERGIDLLSEAIDEIR